MSRCISLSILLKWEVVIRRVPMFTAQYCRRVVELNLKLWNIDGVVLIESIDMEHSQEMESISVLF